MAQQDPKVDPFKPAQPRIPGVPNSGAESSDAPASHALANLLAQPQILFGTLGLLAFLIGGSVYWYSRSTARPVPDKAVAQVAWAETPASAPAVEIPVGPGMIGTTDELSKIWSSKRFDFADPDTGLTLPAVVVHLPRGGFWGFSLREPFGGCRLEYVTDLNRLEEVYHFKGDHPMIGDPCDYSVFDLLKYGPASDNTVVRGAVVNGTALRPPIAIQIKIDGHKIIASRRE